MEKVPRSRVVVFVVLAAAFLVVDLWTKTAAFDAYPVRSGGPWLLNTSAVRFRFFTSLNEGALWGMGQGFAWMFAILSVLAFSGIVYWLFGRGAAHSLWLTVSLALVSAGTLGNLYDRLGLHGIIPPGESEPIKAVRDFFHFQFGGTAQDPALDWAIFNVADICLVTGAIMLMIQSLLAPAPNATRTAGSEA
ncbi:MAG: signal peptidase II [Fuerstiella sp.]